MRIVFVHDKPPFAFPTPSARAQLQLAEALAGLGEDVTILTRSIGVKGVEIHAWGDVKVRYVDSMRDYAREMSLLNPDDCAVVVGTGSWPTTRLPVRETKARILSVPGGYYPWYVNAKSTWRKAWRRAIYNVAQKRIAKLGPVVAGSEWEARDVQTLQRKANPTVLPLGVDLERVRRKAHEGRDAAASYDLPAHYAVVVGEDLPLRRVYLAEAACEGQNLPLVLLGAGKRHRTWHGVFNVQPRTIAEHYGILAGADVVINPVLWEPTSMGLVEALAVGVPFVSSQTGTALELSSLSKCPVFVATRRTNPEACLIGILKGLEHLKTTPPKRDALAAAAHAYGLESVIPRWQALLTKGVLPEPTAPTGSPVVVHGDDEGTSRGIILSQPAAPQGVA